MIKIEEIVLPSKEEEAEGKTVKQMITFFHQNGRELLDSQSQVLHRLAFCSRSIMQEIGMYSGRQQKLKK